MTLRVLLLSARRWILAAAIPALLLGALTYVYEHGQHATYQASATLFVQPGSGDGTAVSPFQAGTLVPTYSQMLGDPIIAQSVQRQLAARYPGYHFPGVQVEQVAAGSLTQLLSYSVTDITPQRAIDGANAVAAALIRRVNQIEAARFARDANRYNIQIKQTRAKIQQIGAQIAGYQGPPDGLNSLRATLAAYQASLAGYISGLQQFQVSADAQKNSLSVYSPAVSAGQVGPHPLRYGLLAALIGLLLGAGLLYLYEYFDDSLQSPEAIEEAAGAPVLGAVERFPRRARGALIVAEQPHSPHAEAYRQIRTNVRYTSASGGPRALVITSAVAQEGKTTTVANLARAFADSGQQVTLVDADLRRPGLHRLFGLDRGAGLSDALAGEQPLNGHHTRAGGDSLMLLTSGPVPPRAADLVGSERMRDVVHHLKDESDLVLLDSPPILAVTDAALLATMADGVILVVNPGRVKRSDIVRAREAIEAVSGKIVGVVINELDSRNAGYYYYAQRYGYGSAADPGPAGATSLPRTRD